eukprot:TRINITY_DN55986_c0_g1_i1.p1 TRINITY_DN55986_c0_g1~~TRINITY_DN55986_c0_g1_i1.p1  ORF type:complete len:844 (-),score=64.29 TRINITY_DN55986_c0_g1_i1:10-2508(-)
MALLARCLARFLAVLFSSWPLLGRGHALPAAAASTAAVVVADGSEFRVQALAASLIRVERRNDAGQWEDRPTYLVRNRSWPGVPLVRTNGTHHTVLSTECCSVTFDWGSPSGLQITAAARRGSGSWTSAQGLDAAPAAPRLPTPSELPAVWPLRDAPRIVPPIWGPTPPTRSEIPFPDTSGFDISSGAADVYFFFPNSTNYTAFRRQLLDLIGHFPILPDYAFGSWFVWYHNYTQAEKQEEVETFARRGFPLDVSGLDMDWRNHPCMRSLTPNCSRYNHTDEARYLIDTDLYPDIEGYMAWLHERNISVFFNDHPMMLDTTYIEMSPKELQFRWDGLTSIMEKGLDFWWFDCHWSATLSGINCSYNRAANPDDGKGFSCVNDGDGIDFVAWEKYVQFEITARFNRQHRKPGTRTMQLGCSNSNHLADHRYPIWWTGDNRDWQLGQAVTDMVNGGLQLKPYVHPDCGGHNGPTGPPGKVYTPEVYIRWVQFCSLGNIFRLHSNPGLGRQPWNYGEQAENISRAFLQMRMALLPMMISAGRRTATDGTPLVRRLDLEFPQFSEAAESSQYLFGDDLLVAPIDPWAGGAWPPNFNRERSIWIPPGHWQDAWSGRTVVGPLTVNVSSSLEQMPIYHRRPSILVCASSAALNVRAQDWRQLVLEVFTDDDAKLERSIFLKDNDEDDDSNPLAPASRIHLVSNSKGHSFINITCESKQNSTCQRTWVVRVHLKAGERVVAADVNGAAISIRADELPPSQASGATPRITARVLRNEDAVVQRRRTQPAPAPALQGRPGALPGPSAGVVLEILLRQVSPAVQAIHVQAARADDEELNTWI